jgi:hypothetical protein
MTQEGDKTTEQAAADQAAAAAAGKAAADTAAADAAAAAAAGDKSGGAGKDGAGDKAGDKGAGAGDDKSGGKDAAADAAAKVPDKYELAIPDGAESYLDADDLAGAGAYAKAKGWTNDEAQAWLEEQADLLAATSMGFRPSLERDPEYGGAKLKDTEQHAQRALDRIRPKDHPRHAAFNRLLVRSGYGNNIEVVSFLADLGRLLAEDVPAGGDPTVKKLTHAERIYGQHAKQ